MNKTKKAMNPIENLVPSVEQCQELAPYWGEKKTVFVWVDTRQLLGDTIEVWERKDAEECRMDFIPAPTMQELYEVIYEKSYDQKYPNWEWLINAAKTWLE